MKIYRHIFHCISAIAISTVFCNCENSEPTVSDQEMPIVVEGWIENGVSPVVMVTHAIDLTQDSVALDNVVEKWCRVSIIDDKGQHILSGRLDKNYMPSFIYTSTSFKGEIGKQYRLRIELENQTIEAESTILPAPSISRLEVVPVENNDSLFFIKAYCSGIKDDLHYKVFVRAGNEDLRYYGSFLGTFEGNEYDADNGITVTRGIRPTYEEDNYSHFFKSGDLVRVKIAVMQPDIYDFWKIYDNTVSLSNNILFSFSSNLPSNLYTVSNGSEESYGIGNTSIPDPLGYWAAYGISESVVKIR